MFQEGQMHFQFVTKYNRDHSHLEDFQPHRRIFGVKDTKKTDILFND